MMPILKLQVSVAFSQLEMSVVLMLFFMIGETLTDELFFTIGETLTDELSCCTSTFFLLFLFLNHVLMQILI